MDIAEDVNGFAEWFGGQEGFSVRAERFDGDVSWLKAAYAAGVAAERERCAKVCEAVGSDLDPQYADHIASAIRSGETGKGETFDQKPDPNTGWIAY